MKKYLWLIIAVIISSCVTLFLTKGRKQERQKSWHDRITDTIIYRDTIPYYMPVPDTVKPNGKTKVTLSAKRLREALDSLPHIRADTTSVASLQEESDNIQIELPMSQSVYKSDDYTAYFSGVNGRLDSIFVYPKREVITIRKPPKHWHIGISGGYGATSQGFKPYIGIGITYSLISF